MINGGLGDDTLTGSNYGDVFQFAYGDGNDIITNFNSNDTIRITDGSSYSTTRSGSDLIVSIGSGSIRLKNASGTTLHIINGSSSDINYISNAVSYRELDGTNRRDYITNSAPYVEIDAEDGNDTIDNYAANVEIDGDDGNDSINVHGYSNVTIEGGNGNDTVVNLGLRNVIEYESGDGNDVIYGFGSTDTIRITDGSAYSTTRSGSDAVVSIGSGSMTLKNASAITLNIVGGSLIVGNIDTIPVDTVPADTIPVDTIPSGNIISISEDSPYLGNTRSNVTILGSEDDDSITNSGSYVNIVESEGENTIRNIGARVTIEGGEDDDYIRNSGSNVSINGGDGDDTLMTYANATLTGNDGDDVFRIALATSSSSVSVNITDLNEEDALSLMSTNTTGFNYSLGNGNMTLRDNTGAIALTLGGVTSFNAISDVEVDLRSDYGVLRTTTTLGKIATLASSGFASLDGVKLNGSGKKLTIKDPFEGIIYAGDYGAKLKTISATAARNPIEIVGNDLNNVIKTGKGGSTLEGGLGKDKITCGKGADVILYADGDGKDTIKKFDATQDKIVIADGTIDSVKIKSKNVELKIGDGSLTVQKVVGQELTIVDEDGVESTYVFTKQNNTLDKARVSTSNQLSTDDYWFEQDSAIADPLGEIISEDAAIDLHFDQLNEAFKPTSAFELASSARKQSKK